MEQGRSDNLIDLVSLKEDDTVWIADHEGACGGGASGFYRHDTQFLSHYRWRLPDFVLLSDRLVDGRTRRQRWARFLGAEAEIDLERETRLARGRVSDRLVLTNLSPRVARVELDLELAASFADLFEVRGWARLPRSIEVEGGPRVRRFRYRARDGLTLSAEVAFLPERAEEGWRLFLAPGESTRIEAQLHLKSPLGYGGGPPLPSARAWRERFPLDRVSPPWKAVLTQAVEDLRALLVRTPYGPYPVAGLPWFAAPFGRDGLLTAYMLLPYAADVAEAVLRFLADYQGKQDVPARSEAPGKIPHELRLGELTRLGLAPFHPNYGTVDATPLFLVVLEAHRRATGSLRLVKELRPAWEAALAWMEHYGDADGDGLLEFSAEGTQGPTVQSWKDSADSMTHADGSLAEPPLAVSEVQGYAYRAYLAASGFYRGLGDRERAADLSQRAKRLRLAFDRYFWIEKLGTYALALDGEKRPLEVLSSDPGQLLWSGIVPPKRLPRLVHTLFRPELWSGWGLRTLATSEKRYNPLSYHNGSVWPHDTALFAGGLAAYGYQRQAQKVAKSLYELALSQPNLRLPELVGGYPRRRGEPPVPYPAACRPQAWAAAALVYLMPLLASGKAYKAQPHQEGVSR